jgi:S1-C subfamily serine protease
MPKRRIFWEPHRAGTAALLLLLLLLPVWAAAGEAEPRPSDAQSAAYRAVADKGNAATVGVYCERGPEDKYYGTGVVITPDGLILTSTTVVPPKARDIRVYFTDHSRLDAEVVEMNEAVESTLLKVPAKDLAFVSIAKDLPKVGERAYSFGNANNMIRFGEQASFSAGLVSGVYEVQSADSQSSYAGLAIETDAAINPGQDGGPLLNSRGQLLGIISLSYSDTRWQGTAVPIPRVCAALKTLKERKASLETKPMVTPLPHDTAAGNPLAESARGLSGCLVALTVERTYPPEKLPGYNWMIYKQRFKNWDTMAEEEKARIMQDFFAAERVLGANRPLRRPGGPVTGLAISGDGWILTSLFNVDEDTAFVNKKGEVRTFSYEGKASELTAFDPKQYEQVKNKVTGVRAKLADGREFEAQIVAMHRLLGVALLKVEAADVVHVDLAARARAPAVGDSVGIMGVLGEANCWTLNSGMVSAEARDRGLRFQFDALLNYGNSGGPVFTPDGQILGLAANPMQPNPVLGRVFTPAELQRWPIAANSGVSFASRADEILSALPELKQGKSVEGLTGPFVGIGMDPRRAFSDRVVVGQIIKDSPAARAGVRRGDEILRFEGTEIDSWKDLLEAIGKHKVGDRVTLTLRRQGRRSYLEINGQQIENEADLKKLLSSLKSGEEFTGRCVKTKDSTMELELTLGERK